MEKRKPHYSLGTIKATFTSVRLLRITKTATHCAESLGITLDGVVAIVQGMTREQFYVKFTTDIEGYLVISFKEK